jgi:hypothetical protein
VRRISYNKEGPVAPADGDVDLLLDYIKKEITKFYDAPGGWPGNIELSLIDAVLSIQAKYGRSADTGVRGAIKRYKNESGRDNWDDFSVLAGMDPDRLQHVLTKQKIGGVLKAEAIVNAAARFVDLGVLHEADVDRNSSQQRTAYCGTKGLGRVTWDYFLMLAGNDGVKPDTLVTRFIAAAIGRKPDPNTVTRLVTEAAGRLGMKVSALDHSIWRHMSGPRDGD